MLKYFPQFYDMYIEYPYDIQRCDAFRYFVLYKYGGIYLDLDIKCKKNLNIFLNNKLVFVKSPNLNINSTYQNSCMMSVPKHPFFALCIDNLEIYKESLYYMGKNIHVHRSTGPMFLTTMYNKYIHSYNEVYIMSKDEFSGDCNSCNKSKCNGGKIFTHLKGESWFSFDSILINKINCNKHYIIIFILILGLMFALKHKKKLIKP